MRKFSESAENIVDIIDARAASAPERPAIVDGRQTIAYAELSARIARCAGHLRERGLGRGDRLGLVLHDHADHLVLILAAASMGASTLSINWQSKIEEIGRIADAFGLRLLIRDPGIRVPTGIPAVELGPAWRSALEQAPALSPIASARRLPFRILLSSGTTGLPKGVELTHDDAMAWCETLRLALGLRSRHRILLPLSLGFTGSLCYYLPHLFLGDTVELFPAFHRPEEFVETAKRHGITGSILVPTMLRRLLALAPDGSLLLPELDYLVCLGAPLSADERRKAKRRLTPGFYDNYGATGAGCITFLTPKDIDAKSESVGRPAPLREVEVADGEGRPLPAGEVGLLRCRGRGVAAGFCNAVAADANESFRDGWLYPGELAWMDDDGYVYVVGRSSDVILRGGQNIYPAEIERTLRLHPAVREAAVVGAPSPEYGEEVVAFVQLAGAVSEREILETCRRHLTHYKVPNAIIPVADFPRNAAGKVLKSELSRILARQASAADRVS